MKRSTMLLVVFIAILFPSVSALSTADRIRKHGYPAEKHKVKTGDGYILTLFRVPYPLHSNITTNRPIALLIHGFTSSSDCWVLPGPGVALPYKLADAGYDVWLGNHRGNTYSRKHVRLSPMYKTFWNFDWHQLGVFDLPAMIDYILSRTQQNSLHVIGHSQGGTVLLVMGAILPKYNAKIKSAQMLAPVVYMNNVRGPLVPILMPLLGLPNAFVKTFGSTEFLPNNEFSTFLKQISCHPNPAQKKFCLNILFMLFGWHKDSINMTIFSDIMATQPAGASINQMIHYAQEFFSGEFRQFDYGFVRNKRMYGTFEPPKYNLKKVTAPIFIYYSNNDFLADPLDVKRLVNELPNVVYTLNVPDPNWNHVDFLWAKNVDKLVYNRVIDNIVNVK